MTTPCELTAPEREHYEETVRALERRIDEVTEERDLAARAIHILSEKLDAAALERELMRNALRECLDCGSFTHPGIPARARAALAFEGGE